MATSSKSRKNLLAKTYNSKVLPRADQTIKFDMTLPGCSTSVELTWRCFGQHTLSWPKMSLQLNGSNGLTHMPAGECNMYTFPRIKCEASPAEGEVAAGGRLAVLRLMMQQIASADEYDVLRDLTDSAGAHFIHGVCVANSPESLDLLVDMVRVPVRSSPSCIGAQPHLHSLTTANWAHSIRR